LFAPLFAVIGIRPHGVEDSIAAITLVKLDLDTVDVRVLARGATSVVAVGHEVVVAVIEDDKRVELFALSVDHNPIFSGLHTIFELVDPLGIDLLSRLSTFGESQRGYCEPALLRLDVTPLDSSRLWWH
jgi:hypothetical protein